MATTKHLHTPKSLRALTINLLTSSAPVWRPLTAACYLVRDGQMQGDHIHVFEKDPLPGGACDGYKYDIGYVMRGGREMDNHFEVIWDLLRSEERRVGKCLRLCRSRWSPYH